MNLETEFLIYVTCFRLAIIATGALCLYLGYRLFSTAIVAAPAKAVATTIEANVAGHKLTVKNAAPGICFGLFGVVIIGFMFFEGSPELTLKTMEKVPSIDNPERVTEENLRGTETQSGSRFEAFVDEGTQFDRKNEVSKAIGSYENAMASVAAPMNQLALDYVALGKNQDAIPLARLAIQFCPERAAFADTLAEALLRGGQPDDAVTWITKAAELDAQYKRRMLEMKHAASR